MFLWYPSQQMILPDSLHNTDIIRESLNAMPRARQMGAEALGLCAADARKVMSSQDFVKAVRDAVNNISRWADKHGEELNEEVRAFRDATDDELIALQKRCHFAGVQLTEWTGEMKMQISGLSDTFPH